eukprot:TRINITY_DN1593_c0_g1_i2.p3 TRINITY_DN1593_c0_g1~~TRINITY_DN1593_c0_g1_i2.p3  ORF type:complete len:119 (-),score=35.60 TRINITY_DN1593_c0_g1_i2:79-435(-)
MFGDGGFKDERIDKQMSAHYDWLRDLRKNKVKVAIVEIGAGKAVPTIREMSHRMLGTHIAEEIDICLIRINPVDNDIPPKHPGKHISIALSAEDSLVQIKQKMDEIKRNKESVKMTEA